MRRSELDPLFREAVAALDAGDLPTLERLLAAHPELARERLKAPGAWLRDQVGRALRGFFKRPYLLWFIAEDPIRNGRLPANIAQVTRAIIGAAWQAGADTFQEQLDYALQLVAWSGVAADCGMQLELIDVLVDAGAVPGRNADNALVNGHVAAAEHLVARGGTLTLAAALCLGRWDDATRLAATTSARDKQFALVVAALNGKAEALRRMLALGAELEKPSRDLYSHGRPLHHAVGSGSLEAVQVLVEAGAQLNPRDKAWRGTPLGWAEHYVEEQQGREREAAYKEIAEYLRGAGATT